MSFSMIGPPEAWTSAFATAQNMHLDLIDRSSSWSEWLKAQMIAVGTAVTEPDFEIGWDAISGSVPITWGGAYTAPTLPSVGGAPTGPDAPDMGTIPDVPGVDVDPAPEWTETLPTEPGTAPVVSLLTVEELDALTLPTFEVTVPSETIAALTAEFEFTPGNYAPTLKTAVSGAISNVLGGEVVIGNETFQDIFTDAADDLTAAYTGEALAAGNECGMLGELPSGALAVRLDVAKAKYRQGLQKVRLGVAVEQAKAWREDFWKGIEAGQAFEQLWTAFFTAEEGRRLQAASAVVEAQVAVYNASVARWNAMLAMVQANVQVAAEHRARALMVIEDHKERLAQRLSDIQAADLQVKAWLGQWDGYDKAASAKTRVFASKVQAYTAYIEGTKTGLEADIAAAKAAIDRENAITTRFAETWRGIATKSTAVLAQMQAEAVPAELQIKSEGTRIQSDNQVLSLAVENAKLALAQGTENAKLRLSQIQFAAGQGMEAQRAVLQAGAHITGAYLAAGSINYGATASGTYGNSNSWSVDGNA